MRDQAPSGDEGKAVERVVACRYWVRKPLQGSPVDGDLLLVDVAVVLGAAAPDGVILEVERQTL